MSATGDAIAARARLLVGVRFRLHGRGRDGLDCVGVVAAATGRVAAGGYPLRGVAKDAVEAGLGAAGLVRVAEPAPGDVLLIESGPAQLHLAIRTAGGFVHAHAGLRRVVETPGLPEGAWSTWRTRGGD